MRAKNNSQKKIDKNFIEIINLLKKNNISYWLCHGTLLGIVRDKNLIPWDHDIDIAVWYKKNLKKKFKNIMSKKNYKLKKKFFSKDDLLTFIKKGGREVDINFYHKKYLNSQKLAYVKWFVPKNFFCKVIDALSEADIYKGKFFYIINNLKSVKPFFKKLKKFLIKKNLYFATIGYTQPEKLLKKFKKIKFKNMKVSVPVLSKDYLDYVYGLNWRKPKKNFNWAKDSPSVR